MQKEILGCIGAQNQSFSIILRRAQSGDTQALPSILDFLFPVLEHLASFIKLPRDESINK
ncbi:hypothetical protein [Brevibacillus sp. HB2.2]|uniref:hypothetical protein n=1 Tax=Brevibacillus sp. HB2.2 TaxID=2738846 RepID=UPI00156AB768|nr:hypothetical protein [Brevibacillus sp. HB2.2]NRS51898.1 hypothetical protein [Brevibacillus sp. HB2.2]